LPSQALRPTPSNAPERWPFAIAAVLAAALVVLVMSRSETAEDPAIYASLIVLEGWCWVGAGLIARTRRPDSRVGLWMAAAGFSWMWGSLEFANPDGVEALGAAFAGTLIPLVLHALLGFPTGVPPVGRAKVLLVAAWTTWGLTALSFVLWPLDAAGCPTCPREAFPIAPGAPAADTISVLGNALAALYLLTAGVLVVARDRASRGGRLSPGTPAALAAAGGSIMGVLMAVDVLGRAAIPEIEPATVLALFAVSSGAPMALLVALVRERLELSGRVARFVNELERSTSAADLERALAGALDDPRVRLGFWLPGGARYVDASGAELTPAAGERVEAIRREGEPVAALLHGGTHTQHPQLLPTLLAAASVEVQRLRLEAELRAKLTELRASRARVIEAADEARRGFERDLHDGAQQRLVAAAVGLRIVRTHLERQAPDAAPLVDGVIKELQEALAELRELAHGLHPSILTELGLGEALRAAAMRSPIAVEVRAVPEQRLPEPVEVTAYYVVCEALANAAKHSQASRITLEAVADEQRLVVEVADDGCGGADRDGSGLRGLEDRVGAVEGQLNVVSPPGEGTLLRLVLPLRGGITPAGFQDGGKPDGRLLV
jgi:signal transduction histidine kinase